MASKTLQANVQSQETGIRSQYPSTLQSRSPFLSLNYQPTTSTLLSASREEYQTRKMFKQIFLIRNQLKLPVRHTQDDLH